MESPRDFYPISSQIRSVLVENARFRIMFVVPLFQTTLRYGADLFSLDAHEMDIGGITGRTFG